MSEAIQIPFSPTGRPAGVETLHGVDAAVELLRDVFDTEFNVLNVTSGRLVHRAADQPGRDWAARAELCRAVAYRGQPEFIDEEDPLLVLSIPISDSPQDGHVAVATFVTRPVEPEEPLERAARLLDLTPAQTRHWLHRRRVWSPETLRTTAALVLDRLASALRIERLVAESHSLSEQLSGTYEEISLLHRITQRLKISESAEELGQAVLEWLAEVIPAEGLAMMLAGPGDATRTGARGDAETAGDVFLSFGECPLNAAGLRALVDHLDLRQNRKPFVANPPVTRANTWPVSAVRQIVVVPLAEGENVFGWLTAVNHDSAGEFGTVEASLMGSVGTILGIHKGNLNLYRQQSEMFRGVVRALASAIDAKDPYTRGHSDRVARVAVRLARELGWDDESLSTIYLSGLLHDIGKIGIDDQVLRKPGKLTDEEYEHIKRHSTVGHRILAGLGKLDQVLPVVLHHHESWDGSGYPDRLRAEEIPAAARVVAVADAFDAMSSDRPYRKGMPDEKIDNIFREGRGQQWDPEVVDAFFRARDDIREIVQHEPGELADNPYGGA